ncbi:MAG: sodium/proline symporter [Planctomycetota bacterium]
MGEDLAMDKSQVIITTLIVYKIVLIAIGFIAERRNKDASDFFLGGRGLGPVVAAISASASSSSAWTLLGATGFAYSKGLAALWLFPACVGGFVINWYLLAPAIRKFSGAQDAVTVTDVLAGRPGREGYTLVRRIAAFIVLVFFSFYVAAQFKAAGTAFEGVFDTSFTASVIIGGSIVVFYTLMGGFWAVSITDTLQGLLMAITAIVLPWIAFYKLGYSGLTEGLQAVGETGFLDLSSGFEGPAAFGFVLGLLGIGLGYPGQPHVVNRFLALKKGEQHLAQARCIAVAWSAVVYVGVILLGLCGRVLYPSLGNGETIFFVAADGLMHPILAGLMVAAVLSAIMSTADSQLLVAASAVTHDLECGGNNNRTRLFRSRLTIVVISMVAMLIAMQRDSTIFDKVLFAWSAMGAAFGPLLLVSVLKGPVKGRRTALAMLTGFGLVVLNELLKTTDFYSGNTAGWAGFGERIIPFFTALAVVLAPGGQETSDSRWSSG